MPILEEIYENTDDPNLESYLAKVRNRINALDDANIATNAGIAKSKIEDGTSIGYHANTHAFGGTDPLGKSSINGPMIAPRALNASHIGMGAIQAGHLSPGALFDNIYFDASPVSYDDGETLAVPDGYEAAKTIPIIVGIDFQKSGGFDRVRLPMTVEAQAGQTVQCFCWAFDGENPNIKISGSIKVIRMAFK